MFPQTTESMSLQLYIFTNGQTYFPRQQNLCFYNYIFTSKPSTGKGSFVHMKLRAMTMKPKIK
jgi:hypothetical protein